MSDVFDMLPEYPEYQRWFAALTYHDAIRKGVGALLMSDNEYQAAAINSLLAQSLEYLEMMRALEVETKVRIDAREKEEREKL